MKLLGSIEPETFFRDTWEKQPLAVARGDPTYYRGLFSRRDVDSVIAFTRPKFLEVGSFKPDAPHSNVRSGAPEEPFTGSSPDLPDFHRAFAHGKTLISDKRARSPCHSPAPSDQNARGPRLRGPIAPRGSAPRESPRGSRSPRISSRFWGPASA